MGIVSGRRHHSSLHCLVCMCVIREFFFVIQNSISPKQKPQKKNGGKGR